MKNIVSCNWLKNHIADKNLFVIDCRFNLFDASVGLKDYTENHIEGAYFLDINVDLSDKAGCHGGARPLPNLAVIIKKLEDIGINTDSTIVFYDEKLYSACRAFYQLKYLGIEKVYVLEGGITEWRKLEFPTSKNIPNKKLNGNIVKAINEDIFCDISYVKQALNNENIILIDSRDENRYTGEYEPLYSKKGHIPTSYNLPWHYNIDEKGFLKDVNLLKENFSFVKGAEEIIVYCGSGIDGAVNFLILDEISYKVRLYVGSMSDWISYDDTIVTQGKEY
ncbi:sulfurtransferase [Clostridium sp. DL1XJH146]